VPVDREAYVIGAGPSGLSAGAMLRRAGVDVEVLERDGVAASWRRHYDRLHLHTVRWLSHLPGLRFSAQHGRWVHRDGVVRYLESYVRHHDLDVRDGVGVERIDRHGGGWVLGTSVGQLRARYVVVATGYNHTPFMPDWPGRESYQGDLVHASEYRNPEAYRGRDVLIVGTGNTGAEIAVDLIEGGASRVRIAVRTPPNIVLREAGGIPTQVTGVLMRYIPPPIADRLVRPVQRMTVGDLSGYGLPEPPEGVYTRVRRDDVIPIIDVGLIRALKERQVDVVAAVEGFDGQDVLLADGSRISPDAVIAATGYRRGLESLVGHLGVLGANGRPLAHGPRTHPSAPGLHFLGYTNPVSGMFLEIGIDARRIARAIRRDREMRARVDGKGSAERVAAGAA
jgi:putative flavoprotein involved in K+ transport